MFNLKVVCTFLISKSIAENSYNNNIQHSISRPRKMKNVVLYRGENNIMLKQFYIEYMKVSKVDTSMTHCLFCSENFLLYIISPLILYYIYLVLMISQTLFTCQFLFTFIAYSFTERKFVSLCKPVSLLKYVYQKIFNAI